MSTRVSKHFGNGGHDGWKKTVAGREWFLGYGLTAEDEARARRLAGGLEAKWQLARLSGANELTQADFEEVKDLISGRPPAAESTPGKAAPVSAATPVGVTGLPTALADDNRRWLFDAIDQFTSFLKLQIKLDNSNADHMLNKCDRLIRARDGVKEDMPLDHLRRKELDEWLLFFSNRPASKTTGDPIGPITIRNITQAIRVFLCQCIEWEWWSPPPLWEKAFKPYTLTKIKTDAEKRQQTKRPETHTLAEKRVLWHLAMTFQKAMMALADWAGHTQMEAATLHFDEIIDVDGEMHIDRFRHKTGVRGRWWIPPEPAAAIRAAIAKTPRDAKRNPEGLAFLTSNNLPIVHRAKTERRARSDFVRQQWATLLRWSADWGVRGITFKYMRKGTAQRIRDISSMEMSMLFCAHVFNDIQTVHYSRPSFDELERHMRTIYCETRGMFEPITAASSQLAIDDVYRSRGMTPPRLQPAA